MTETQSRTNFLDKLRTGARACGLTGQQVLIGVSGGADSVALLCGLTELSTELQLAPHSAHFNHNLRGDESAADAAWVESLCRKLNVPLTLGTAPAAAPPLRAGIEESAREARYAFLQSTAEQQNCTHVAVAHTADDQVETILHHIVRGTGLDGLTGMPRSRSVSPKVTLVRPLLDIARDEVLEYLRALGQDFRRDEMNTDERFTRTRMRHTLLPLLRREFNPQVDEAILRLARQAEEAQTAIGSLADALLAAALEDRQPDIGRLNVDQLAGQPRHLVRECLVRLWHIQQWPRQRMGFAEWDRLAEVALTGGSATLPGNIEARRRGNLLILRRK